MKRTCIFLLTIIALTYGYQGYKTIDKYVQDKVKVKTDGRLSDISNDITAVPLEAPDSGVIRQVKRVQRDGNHLFLLGDNRLLHFDMSGTFLRQIDMNTSGEEAVFIADYTLDTDLHQVIVIDSQRNIHKYDYAGNLLSTAEIRQPWHKMTAFAYHNGHLWITARKLIKNDCDLNTCQIIHSLHQLDTDMNEIACFPLRIANVGRGDVFQSYHVDELLADEHGVYAYTSQADMGCLLQDTLQIIQRKQLPLMYTDQPTENACIFPVRKGNRFFMSTSFLAADGYTFCYDSDNQTAFLLSDGFRDDFFHTGMITDLQPMDIYNQTYCFLKSGTEIAGTFSERAINNDLSVLFIVPLKS